MKETKYSSRERRKRDHSVEGCFQARGGFDLARGRSMELKVWCDGEWKEVGGCVGERSKTQHVLEENMIGLKAIPI